MREFFEKKPIFNEHPVSPFQVYGPCVLLVVISWVSFWLNREATSDRISLGITTVLTMTFMGLEARKDLPKVTYPTALDYFVFISFMYIFSTVVQVTGDFDDRITSSIQEILCHKF